MTLSVHWEKCSLNAMTCDMKKKMFSRVSVHSILRGPPEEIFFFEINPGVHSQL